MLAAAHSVRSTLRAGTRAAPWASATSRPYTRRQRRTWGGAPSIKVSCISDRYSSSGSYLGLIIYSHHGASAWTNKVGIKAGYRSRAMYVVIKALGDESKGGLHEQLFQQMFKEASAKGQTCCGAFSVIRGEHKFRSKLNSIHGAAKGKHGQEHTWTGDGSRGLGSSEEAIVRAAINAWVLCGPNTVIAMPDAIHQQLSATALVVVSEAESDSGSDSIDVRTLAAPPPRVVSVRALRGRQVPVLGN